MLDDSPVASPESGCLSPRHERHELRHHAGVQGSLTSNQFLLYTRDEAKDNNGKTLPVTGNQLRDYGHEHD